MHFKTFLLVVFFAAICCITTVLLLLQLVRFICPVPVMQLSFKWTLGQLVSHLPWRGCDTMGWPFQTQKQLGYNPVWTSIWKGLFRVFIYPWRCSWCWSSTQICNWTFFSQFHLGFPIFFKVLDAILNCSRYTLYSLIFLWTFSSIYAAENIHVLDQATSRTQYFKGHVTSDVVMYFEKHRKSWLINLRWLHDFILTWS